MNTDKAIRPQNMGNRLVLSTCSGGVCPPVINLLIAGTTGPSRVVLCCTGSLRSLAEIY